MGASGHKIAMATFTIRPTDARWLDPANRRGKVRAADPHVPNSALTGESARYASWAWNRLRLGLGRRMGARAYFRGLEVHKSGMVHLHVLVRVADATDFLHLRTVLRGDERERSRVGTDDRRAGLAINSGFGPVVDVTLARSGGDVAKYVTKAASGDVMGFEARESSAVAGYASKGVAGPMPRYTRRSTWSVSPAAAWAPGWVKPTPIGGFWWRVESRPSIEAAAIVRSQGFTIGDPERFRVRVVAVEAAGGS
jgi:hypothetical protein